MVAADNNIPVSVDYTGRDYYALREALIARVKDRVPAWQGNDPNDFGLALIEAFAYLGDNLNYYIDRSMNESSILTATQRSSLLSLAATYGYRPSHYVAASTDLQITSTLGYTGQIGAAIIEDGNADFAGTYYCKIVVPTDHPFTDAEEPAEGKFNLVKVSSVASSVSTTIASQPVTYSTSVFNGVFKVLNVGYDSIGNNVLWYRPSAAVYGVDPYSYAVSSASSDGTKHTYVALNHRLQKDDVVTISGFSTSAFNLTGTVSSVTSQVFTVTPASPAASGAAAGSGTVTSSNRFVITLNNADQTLTAYSGQNIVLSDSTSSGQGWNGRWVVSSSTDATDTSKATIIASTLDRTTKVTSGKKSADESRLVFSSVNYVVPGQTVTVSGATPSAWNVTGVVSTTHHVDAAISRAKYESPNVTYYTNKPFTQKTFTITSFAISSDVVTITTSVDHEVTTTGQTLSVSNIPSEYSYLVGNYPITGYPSSTELTFSLTHADVSSTSLITGTAAIPLETVTIQGIYSTDNPLSTVDRGYNVTDKAIAGVTEISAVLQAVDCGVPGPGQVRFQTEEAHSFKVGDYVTIRGVVNDTTSSITRNDLLNIDGAKIISVPDGGDSGANKTFVIQGYWDLTVSPSGLVGATATQYAFTVAGFSGGSTPGTLPSGAPSPIGSAYSEYFTVPTPDGWSNPTSFSGSTTAKVTPVVGGTYASGGEVVFDYIPAVITSGATVTNIGYTVVPKGTQVSTQIPTADGIKNVVFSTQSDVSVPFQDTETVLAVQGEDVSLRTENAEDFTRWPYDIRGELLGFSTGEADQVFLLKDAEVNTGTVKVFVDTGVEWETWQWVAYLQDYGPSAKVFSTAVTAEGEVEVLFGDGVSGKIPTKEAGIKASYISGGGTIGNVPANSLTTWDVIRGVNADLIRTNMTVTNPFEATGGAEPESNDSIRYNAPRSLRSLNRAVTLEDFGNLALAVDGIVKANAVATTRSNVTVYIAPNASGSSDETPGVIGGSGESGQGASTQMEQFKQAVASYLADKKQIGTTVTVLEPKYTYVAATIQYSALPQYNAGSVGTAIKNALFSSFNYENNDFEDVITPEEIEFKLRQVDGVANVRVTGLSRTGGSGRNSLIGDPDEIFVFVDANVILNEASSESRLATAEFLSGTGLGAEFVAAGTIVQTPLAINGEVYSYLLSVPVGTTTIRVNATAQNENATITVSDKETKLVAGKYQADISILNRTSLTVTVTAQDGVSTKVYKFKLAVATT